MIVDVKDAKSINIICSDVCLDKLSSLLAYVDDPDIKELYNKLSSYPTHDVLFCDQFGKVANRENEPKIIFQEGVPF